MRNKKLSRNDSVKLQASFKNIKSNCPESFKENLVATHKSILGIIISTHTTNYTTNNNKKIKMTFHKQGVILDKYNEKAFESAVKIIVTNTGPDVKLKLYGNYTKAQHGKCEKIIKNVIKSVKSEREVVKRKYRH